MNRRRRNPGDCNNISHGDKRFDVVQEILFAKLAMGSQNQVIDRLQSIGLYGTAQRVDRVGSKEQFHHQFRRGGELFSVHENSHVILNQNGVGTFISQSQNGTKETGELTEESYRST